MARARTPNRATLSCSGRSTRTPLSHVSSLIGLSLALGGCVHGGGIGSMCSPKLRQFLHQHPEAAKVLTEAVANRHSSGPLEIYYFYADQESIPSGSHSYSEDGVIGIMIRENQTPTDELITLLYEVINSEGKDRFKQLHNEARSRAISRKEFAEEVLKTEFRAVKKTRGLLPNLNLTGKEISGSGQYKRFLNCPEDFDGFLVYTKEAAPPHKDATSYYESQYDQLGQPH